MTSLFDFNLFVALFLFFFGKVSKAIGFIYVDPKHFISNDIYNYIKKKKKNMLRYGVGDLLVNFNI